MTIEKFIGRLFVMLAMILCLIWFGWKITLVACMALIGNNLDKNDNI